MSNTPFLFVPTFSWPAAPFGLLYSYQAGSTTPKTTYSDAAGIEPNTNPIELDATGSATIRLGAGSYKFVLLDQTNTVTLWEQDNYDPQFLTQAAVGAVFYPQTAGEIAVDVTPTALQYPADPYVDPRRYGADPLGVTDSTVAMQIALNVAYASSGLLWIGEGCNYLVGQLFVTMNGANTTGLRITGSSTAGSRLTVKNAISGPVLTFTSGNPSGLLIDCFLKLQNFTVSNPNAITTGGHGISIQGLADWQLQSVQIAGFDNNLDLVSSLIGICDADCQFVNGNIGISITLSGTVNTTNLIKLEKCRLIGNKTWGLQFNGGAQLHVRSCDIEQNGTSGNSATGGVHIKGQLAPDSLVAGVLLHYNWFEANLGTTILVDAQTGGCSLNFALVGGHILNAQSGASFICNGATQLLIEDLSYSDTCALNANNCTIINSEISTLNDLGVSHPTYINLQTSGGFIYAGQVTGNVSLGLTGCTTNPTVNATFVLQGDQVTCYIPDFTATSNANSCTITNIPAKYQPAVQKFMPMVIENAGADSVQQGEITGGTGIIILYQGGSQTGFTTSGSKGIRSQELRWRLT